MHKTNKLYLFILLIIFFFFLFSLEPLLKFDFFSNKKIILNNKNIEEKKVSPDNFSYKFLFTGDIFLDRHIDEKSRESELKFAYPFSGLKTLGRENYDAWIGNLECPVTEEQSTKYEKETYLKFSCKKEYLPELKKYFDIVSLANNHTDNMGKRKGIEETRKHLEDVGIEYFGDYDNSQSGEVCKILFLSPRDFPTMNIPFVFCGFHGVFQLPTDDELEIVKEYSKYFITFVMPHQGEEYKFTSNTYQKKIYRKIIDDGADVVFGAHPHVVQEIEDYKNKKIFYSLGNFIFDQSWIKTREHMVIKTEINFTNYKNNYSNLNCKTISSLDCLELAKKLSIDKPEFSFNFTPLYTFADLDFVTKLKTK